MLTTHPPMRSPRPSPKPSSKVPIMSLTKSSTPSVPPPTSSPSHWQSSEFAERFSYRGQFHSQLSVPCVIPSNSPHIRSRSCFVADIVVPPSFHLLGTADIHNTYTHAKLSPGLTTSAVPKSCCVDSVAGALGMGQQKFFPSGL